MFAKASRGYEAAGRTQRSSCSRARPGAPQLSRGRVPSATSSEHAVPLARTRLHDRGPFVPGRGRGRRGRALALHRVARHAGSILQPVTRRRDRADGALPRPEKRLHRPTKRLLRVDEARDRITEALCRPSGDVSSPAGDVQRLDRHDRRLAGELFPLDGAVHRPVGVVCRPASELRRLPDELSRPSNELY